MKAKSNSAATIASAQAPLQRHRAAARNAKAAARAAQRVAFSSAVSQAVSKAGYARASKAVPNPYAQVFFASFELGYRFGEALARRYPRKPQLPSITPPTAIPAPLPVKPRAPYFNPLEAGWTHQFGCDQVGGINRAATGNTVCNGLRTATRTNWDAGGGIWLYDTGATMNRWRFRSFRQFHRYRTDSIGNQYADYYGSGTWDKLVPKTEPAPEEPYVPARPAALLPPPELQWYPQWLGMATWANPAAAPILPSYEPEPFVMPYRALPKLQPLVNQNVPLHVQRYHGNVPQPAYDIPPRYNPRMPYPFNPYVPLPDLPSAVEAPPAIVLGHAQGVPVQGHPDLKVAVLASRYHLNQKPPKDEKEIKAKYRGAFKRLNAAVGGLTEAEEIVTAVYDAIPISERPRYKNTRFYKRNVTFMEKVGTIYKSFEKVDWDKALKKIEDNFYEDIQYAKLGKGIGERNAQLGLSPNAVTGIARMNRKTDKMLEYQKRQREYAEKQLDSRADDDNAEKSGKPPRPLWWRIMEPKPRER